MLSKTDPGLKIIWCLSSKPLPLPIFLQENKRRMCVVVARDLGVDLGHFVRRLGCMQRSTRTQRASFCHNKFAYQRTTVQYLITFCLTRCSAWAERSSYLYKLLSPIILRKNQHRVNIVVARDHGVDIGSFSFRIRRTDSTRLQQASVTTQSSYQRTMY